MNCAKIVAGCAVTVVLVDCDMLALADFVAVNRHSAPASANTIVRTRSRHDDRHSGIATWREAST